ncbi:MAG: hypothetical protein R6T83_03690 [Salinibacter sp.]
MTTLVVALLMIVLTASIYYGLQDRSEQRQARRRRDLVRRQRQDLSAPRRTNEAAPTEKGEEEEDERPGRDAILGWTKRRDEGDRRL